MFQETGSALTAAALVGSTLHNAAGATVRRQCPYHDRPQQHDHAEQRFAHHAAKFRRGGHSLRDGLIFFLGPRRDSACHAASLLVERSQNFRPAR
jgi:hypothetical protein